MPLSFLKAFGLGHNNANNKKPSYRKPRAAPIQVNGKPISSPMLIGSSTGPFLASSNEQEQRQQHQMVNTPPPPSSSLTLELHEVMCILELKSPLSPEEQRQRILAAVKRHEEQPLPTLPLVLPLPLPLLQSLEDLNPASSSSSSASSSSAPSFLFGPEDLISPPSLYDSSSSSSFASSSEQDSPLSRSSTHFQTLEDLPQTSPSPPFEICMQCVISMEQCLSCFRAAQVTLPHGGDPACDGCRRGLCASAPKSTPTPTPTVPLVVALAAAHSPQFGSDTDSLSCFPSSSSSCFVDCAASGTHWPGDCVADDDLDGGTTGISFQATEYLQPMVYNAAAVAMYSESEADASGDRCIEASLFNHVDEDDDDVDGWVVSDPFSPWRYLALDLDFVEIHVVDNTVVASGRAKLVSIERTRPSG